jgi:hypothetical protein
MLQLDDRYKVTVDSSCQNYQLEELQDIKNKQSGEVVRQDFKIIGFHGNSMRSVLLQYVRESLITDDKLNDIHKVFDKLVELDNTIIRVVKKENFKLASKSDD